jgi:hypothetical protein
VYKYTVQLGLWASSYCGCPSNCEKYVQLEAKLDAQRISLNNRIKELELRKNPMEHNELTDREIARRIAFVLYKGGLDAKGNPIDGEDPL